jgi:hypothetical protein
MQRSRQWMARQMVCRQRTSRLSGYRSAGQYVLVRNLDGACSVMTTIALSIFCTHAWQAPHMTHAC